MLTQKEKEGLKEILQRLDNLALASLAGTTTKGLIKAETRNEAMIIILMYSENAFTLLNRRKIKKEILFQYLKDNGVAAPSAEKAKLVMVCLKFWESEVNNIENLSEMEELIEDQDETSSPEMTNHNDPDQLSMPLVQASQPLVQTTRTVLPEETLQYQVALEGTHTTDALENMGRQFVAWFYGLLNNICAEPRNFHPDHFWPDCKMYLSVQISGHPFNAEQILGAQNVTDSLIGLVSDEQLFFHPNANHYGVTCSMDRHGLVRILASGVLHKGVNCIGLFDQVFGLVRSANSEDNWRIKYLELCLKQKKMHLQITT